MAGLALCLGMLPQQGKAGHAVMVEIDFPPGILIVAAATILPIAALMGVIRSMAAKAGHRRAGDLGFNLVAPRAACSFMRAAKREFRQAIMVKYNLLPRT